LEEVDHQECYRDAVELFQLGGERRVPRKKGTERGPRELIPDRITGRETEMTSKDKKEADCLHFLGKNRRSLPAMGERGGK